MRNFFSALLLGCSVLTCVAETPLATKATNVIILFVDDMGYADIEPFGNKTLRTPNLKRFAQEGMRFTNFYATPVCSMSRASLLTGCYNARISMPGVLFPQNRVGLHPDEITFAEVAKTRGYATMLIGKWHLGHQAEFLPTHQGFDQYFGLPYSNDMKQSRNGYPPLPLYRDTKVIETEPDQDQLTRRYTEEAVKFLEAKQAEPFLLYLPYSMIHAPVGASEQFKGKSAEGLVGDSIEEIDWSVGQILDTLRRLKIDEQTLVIFSSDNGPDRRPAPPFSGNKGTNLEGGVREPCLMRWPRHIPAGTTCERMAGNIDVLPTLAKVFGAELPKDRIIDGRDLSSLLANPNAAAVRDTHLYFTASQKLEAIRQGQWKLFLLNPAKRKGEPERAIPSLYDLATDLAELTNVAAQNPAVVIRLTKEANERVAEIEAHKRPIGQHGDALDAAPAGLPPVVAVGHDPKVLKVGTQLRSNNAPPVGGKGFSISCVYQSSQPNTVLVSHGGTQLGYSLHIREGQLTFSLRRSSSEESEVTTPVSAADQPHQVIASLGQDGMLSLQIDNQTPVTSKGSGVLSKQPAEDFCVGADPANPAARYVNPAPFKGTLTDLKIR